MALAPGTHRGPYEIHSAIGAGGMGEVYRARDTKLDRNVAIKILPEAFAHDPERLARFEREAKLLASDARCFSRWPRTQEMTAGTRPKSSHSRWRTVADAC